MDKDEKKTRISSNKLLAVEGKDELNFFEEFLKHELIEDVQRIDIGGKDKFSIGLGSLRTLEGFDNVTVIGFVRDAESDRAASAFKSICGILKKNSLPVPKTVDALASGPPKIGIFIMPDNQGAGMLENLCLTTLDGQNIGTCIQQYIDCFAPNMAQTEREIFNPTKAKVQTYLSSRAPIATSLGVGALKGYWDFTHPCFNQIRTFLHHLFDER